MSRNGNECIFIILFEKIGLRHTVDYEFLSNTSPNCYKLTFV